jgi:uncharacterized protein involved in exopolysaccharide biosynthesis
MARIRTLLLADGRSATARANRRRQLVFGSVLALSLLVSLVYVFQRPAQYLATARWQFVFPGTVEPSADGAAAAGATPAGSPAFLTELQVVTSRPLVERLHAALQAGGVATGSAATRPAGADPVDALQRALDVRPVAGTTIVEVRAVGDRPAPLPVMVNTLFDLYRRHLDERYQTRSGADHVKAREEAEALAAKVTERRAAVNAFRERHAIVSGERDENEVLARFKGQSVALNAANEKLVAAEAKLRSLSDSAASGKASARARDNPGLVQLEQRTAQAREELRTMERSYTEAYMTLDPNAKALRTRVAVLEEQLGQARKAAQQQALADAEEEAATARLAVDRVGKQMGSARQGVQSFSARMAEYKSMQDELDRLEKMQGAAQARATALEAGSRRIAPSVSLLEPAATPQSPWRPDYHGDALIAGAGSLGLALLALFLVELLNRPEVARPAQATPIFPPPGWDDVDTRPWVQQRTLGPGMQGFALAQPAPAPVGLMIGADPPPRELDDEEVGLLLEAAAPSMRPFLVGLLSGLQVDELVGLDRADVDPSGPLLRLPERSVHLQGPLLALLANASAEAAPAAPWRAAAHGRRLSSADVDAGVVFAAHDAGLPGAAQINAAALRHTFVASLVRQGARFADLARWTGKLSPSELTPYAAMAPSAPKRAAEQVDPVLPALRRFVSQ